MQIGAQLYTLRTYAQNEKDLGRTLERVAGIGYRTVQISGVGPVPPKRIKALCDDNGLRIVLTHIPEADFLERIDETIERHQMFGCRYVGTGGLPDRYRQHGWVRYYAEDFAEAARRLKEAGLLFMYHNHAFEFARQADGRTLMDQLLEALPADLMGVTADTYWLQYAGVDVNDWLQKHADRLHCVHLKDMTPHLFECRMAAVGRGNLNFPAILDTLKNNGVTEYALVEQDDCYGESPFECMKQSFDYLTAQGC